MKYALFILLSATLALAACQSPTSSGSSSSQNTPTPTPTSTATPLPSVVPVTPLIYSDVAASGASTDVRSIADVRTLFQNQGTLFRDVESNLQLVPTANGYNSSAGIRAEVAALQQLSKGFGSSKAFSYTSPALTNQYTNCIWFNALSGNAALTATTFDNQAIASDGSNLQSFSASASGSVDGTLGLLFFDVPTDVKAMAARANVSAAGGAVWSKPQNQATTQNPGTLALTVQAAVSASVAVSAKSGNLGGIIIVNAAFQGSQKEQYPFGPGVAAPNPVTFATDLSKSGTTAITLTAYSDAGSPTFTKVYTNIQDLINDLTAS